MTIPFIASKYHSSSFSKPGTVSSEEQSGFEILDDDTPVSNSTVRESIQPGNLVPVFDVHMPPWTAMYRFDSFLQGKLFVTGTGFLIGSRLLLTAGHMLFSAEHSCWFDEVKVYKLKLTQNDEANWEWEEVTTSCEFRSTVGWVMSKNYDADYGAVLLPKDSPTVNQQEWFGFGVIDENQIKSFLFHTAGYPYPQGSDKEFGLCHASDAVLNVHERTIEFSIRSYPGMSGSPLWLVRDDGERIVFGIHHLSQPNTTSSAVRITEKVFANLCLWLKESKADSCEEK